MSYETQKALHAQLPTIARAIAKALPGQWTADVRHEHYVRLQSPSGAALGINANGYKGEGRLAISGCFEATGPDREHVARNVSTRDLDNAEMTVSATKDAGTIAADITRRCLATYLPAYATFQKRVEEHRAYETSKRTLAERITKALGGIPRQHGGRHSDVTVDLPSHVDGISGDVACFAGDVTMTLRLDADAAGLVAAFLGSLIRDRAKGGK